MNSPFPRCEVLPRPRHRRTPIKAGAINSNYLPQIIFLEVCPHLNIRTIVLPQKFSLTLILHHSPPQDLHFLLCFRSIDHSFGNHSLDLKIASRIARPVSIMETTREERQKTSFRAYQCGDHWHTTPKEPITYHYPWYMRHEVSRLMVTNLGCKAKT